MNIKITEKELENIYFGLDSLELNLIGCYENNKSKIKKELKQIKKLKNKIDKQCKDVIKDWIR